MQFDPNNYAPGTLNHSRYAEKFGNAGANYIYSQVLAGRSPADAVGDLKYGVGWEQSASPWQLFWSQIYNAPLQAPIEQAGKVISNAIESAGDAAKDAATKAAKNWGAWLIFGALLFGAFLYFGGAALIRKKFNKATA